MSQSKIRQHVTTTLARIRAKGTATAKDVELHPVEAMRLEAQGLLRRAGTKQTGRRGRPAIVWGLTDKAHKRVKRATA